MLIKNGIVAIDGSLKEFDVQIKGCHIQAIGSNLQAEENERILDAKDCLVVYGLADVHVHFREPGYSYKETIHTGSLAAAHGGYTTVCTMPNLSPAPDSPENLAEQIQIIEKDAVIETIPYATITKERKGKSIVDFGLLKDKVAGFSDDGTGVQDIDIMRKAMIEAHKHHAIIAAHEEDNSLLNGGYIHDGKYAKEHNHKGICSESEWKPIARDIQLVEETGCHLHVCHISTKESVDLIRKAQQKGLPVSCETGPHYLVLCDEDLEEDARFKMNPPLRSKEDQMALIEGIKDGTINCIATDHAPHSAEEKSKGLAKSAMGIVGLETAFPILYTHLVKKGIISLEKLVELMSSNPRKLFKLGGEMKEGEFANIAIFDLKNPNIIQGKDFLSKGKSTPFEGWEVYGNCVCTLYKGNIVWNKN